MSLESISLVPRSPLTDFAPLSPTLDTLDKGDSKVAQVVHGALIGRDRSRTFDTFGCVEGLDKILREALVFDLKKRLDPKFNKTLLLNLPFLEKIRDVAIEKFHEYNEDDHEAGANPHKQFEIDGKLVHFFCTKEKALNRLSAYTQLYNGNMMSGGLKEFTPSLQMNFLFSSEEGSNPKRNQIPHVCGQLVAKLSVRGDKIYTNFHREVYYLQLLQDNDHVCKILDASIEDRVVFTKLCKEGDLFDYPINNRAKMLTLLPKFFIFQLKGLAAIHGKNLVHSDIKPENYLVDGDEPRITDFGAMVRLHSENCADETECENRKITKAKADIKKPSSEHNRAKSLSDIEEVFRLQSYASPRKISRVVRLSVECPGEPSRHGTPANYCLERLTHYLNQDDPSENVSKGSKRDDVISMGAVFYLMLHAHSIPVSYIAEYAVKLNNFFLEYLGPRSRYENIKIGPDEEAVAKDFLVAFDDIVEALATIDCSKAVANELDDFWTVIQKIDPAFAIKDFEDNALRSGVVVDLNLYDKIRAVKQAFIDKLTEMYKLMEITYRSPAYSEKRKDLLKLRPRDLVMSLIEETQLGVPAAELLERYERPLQAIAERKDLIEEFKTPLSPKQIIRGKQSNFDSFAYVVSRESCRGDEKKK